MAKNLTSFLLSFLPRKVARRKERRKEEGGGGAARAPLRKNAKEKNTFTKPNPKIGEHLLLLNADRHGSFQETSVRGGEMETPLVQSRLLHDARKVS